jgi:hypothetical protein
MPLSEELVMRETLHIFLKDVRGLRWQILAVLAVTLVVGYCAYAADFLDRSGQPRCSKMTDP